METTAEDKKKLPIDISDFKEIIQGGYYYIDKTSFIMDCLEHHAAITVITRPEKFGKSLNMSMLRYFLEIGTDPHLFDGLEISQETELCEKYMGKFPIIHLNFSTVYGNTYEEARDALLECIRKEILRHRYVLESDEVNSFVRDDLIKILHEVPENAHIEFSLLHLCWVLHEYHKERVITLIDDYDVPLIKSYENGYYDKMEFLIGGLYSVTLAGNAHDHFSVLMGRQPLGFEMDKHRAGNLDKIYPTDYVYAKSTGFTEHEVQELLAYYNLNSQYRTVVDWYGGYNFGDKIKCCSGSIIKYTHELLQKSNAKPQVFCSDEFRRLIYKFFDNTYGSTKHELFRMINGWKKPIKVYPDMLLEEQYTYGWLDSYRWSLLYDYGYVTYEPERIGGRRSTFELLLRVPNKEQSALFIRKMWKWAAEKGGEDTEKTLAASLQLWNDEKERLRELLLEYLPEYTFCTEGNDMNMSVEGKT